MNFVNNTQEKFENHPFEESMYHAPTDFQSDNSTVSELKKFRATTIKNDPNRYTATRFHLTLHGQSPSDLQALVDFFSLPSFTKRSVLGPDVYIQSEDEANKVKVVSLAVIAREFGKFKIHPHWQIYFELSCRTGMYTLLSSLLGHENFHLEKAKSTSSASIAYIYSINKIHEGGFVVYNKNAPIPERYDSRAAIFWENFVPRPFQQKLLDLVLSKTPDLRKIYYIHEPNGNVGKSIFIEYLHIYHGAIVTGGKSEDMKYAVERWSQITGAFPVYICIDVARSSELTHDSIKAIESLKNGLFFSGKYESAMTHSFKKPHVLIFSNSAPDTSWFSDDRWEIYTVDSKHDLVKN